MHLLPDGKMLVAGSTYNWPSGEDFFLARFLQTGALDTTAGGAGFVVTDFSGGDDVPYTLAVQPDAKIILAGTSDGKFALARYRADLSVETQELNGSGFLSLLPKGEGGAHPAKRDGRLRG